MDSSTLANSSATPPASPMPHSSNQSPPSPTSGGTREKRTLSSLADVDHDSHPDLDDSMAVTTSNSYGTLSYHVPAVKPLMFSPVTFISTSRTTHSDVMSISNTIRAIPIVTRPSNQYLRARLPYSETAAFKQMPKGIDPKHMTILEKQAEKKSRARHNRELHLEHRIFMERLKQERDERIKIESGAAIHIQRSFRGFAARPKTNYVNEFKETKSARRLLMNSKANLTHDLLEMTERVGLQPIPGLTLNSRKMMEREKQEEELKHLQDMEMASVQLQSVMRAKLGKKRAKLIREEKIKKEQMEAALVIQRFERGMWGRMIYKEMIRKEQEEAITRIQARIRSNRGRLESEQKKKALQRKKRQHNAAVTVQSIFRGKMSRRKVTAPSYEKVFHRRQQSMYLQMEKTGMEFVDLGEDDKRRESTYFKFKKKHNIHRGNTVKMLPVLGED